MAFLCVSAWASADVTVVAANAIIADWVEQVGGDQVKVTAIVGPGEDPHHFSPSPRDIGQLEDADLIFGFGLGMEPWLEDAMLAVDARGQLVILTDGLDLLEPGEAYWLARQPLYPNAESRPACCRGDAIAANKQWAAMAKQMPASKTHDHDDHLCDDHGEKDPHVWLDPQMALLMVLEINTSLNEQNPKYAKLFDQRREEYLNQLIEMDEWAEAKIDEISVRSRMLVTYHDNLRYFGQRYGLFTPANILGSVTTESADPSARNFAKLLALMDDLHVSAVFVDATANPRLAQQAARESGLPEPVVLYTGNLTEPTGSAPDYLSLMRYNVSMIADALN